MASTRRTFLTASAASAAALLLNQSETNNQMKNIFVHHVYFWLKNPDSKTDMAKLKEGLEKLSKVKTIRQFHIGKPADTNREVIDRSYAISWLALFDNKANQDSYQTDPIHLDFVKECSGLWNKVTVYDSIDA
ncbi:MAG: Dabb family protein [Chitinophagaceae bacterium]|nr:Dabb family protein [Chitinophagaceae bacterium]